MSKSKRHVFLDPENLQGKNANPHVDLMEVTCATHFGLLLTTLVPHINWTNQADRGNPKGFYKENQVWPVRKLLVKT